MASQFFRSLFNRIAEALGEPAVEAPAPRPAVVHPRFEDHNVVTLELLGQWASDPSTVWPFLNHRSGYTRQAALRALSGPITSSDQLIALAQRLNDWVPEVRKVAAEAAERLFPTASTALVVEASPYLIGRWQDWKRWEVNGELALEGVLNQPAVMEQILRRIETSPTGPNARHLKYLLENSWIDSELPRLWQNARQPSVRKLAFETLLYGETRWVVERQIDPDKFAIVKRREFLHGRKLKISVDLLPLVIEGLSDRVARIRWIAAGALVDNRVDMPDLDTVIRRLTADDKASVRERGEFLARRHGVSR